MTKKKVQIYINFYRNLVEGGQDQRQALVRLIQNVNMSISLSGATKFLMEMKAPGNSSPSHTDSATNDTWYRI